MKKLLMSLFSIMLVFCWTGKASALSQTFQDKNDINYWVDSNGSNPAYYVYLNFPNSEAPGTSYSNGVFKYDDYVGNVEHFTITLGGYDDNSSQPIDIFLDFDNDHSDYLSAASRNVDNNVHFTLTLDIENNDLLYNGTDVDNLTNVSLLSFLGYDSFYVGCGCHFNHDYTEVDVGVDSPPAPEPGTMLLLGTGFIGLAGFRKKFKS